MFTYFLSLAIKKFDAIIILPMRRVWETKHLFFWPKLVRTSHMNTLHVYSHVHVPAVTSCSNFSPVTTSWLFDTALFYYQYVNIYIYIFYSSSRRWDWNQNTLFLYVRKHNVFMSDFPYPKLLKVPLSCFMD